MQSPSQFSFQEKIPDGDDRPRQVCRDCGWIHYVNPKIVVGAVCTWQDQILLCKRAIEPRKGYWTIPAGYLEEGETPAEGAAREAEEEANADIAIDALLAVYAIPRISQVQLIYRAALNSAEVSAGAESLAVSLVDWADIPWSALAFPSVYWALHHHQSVQGQTLFAPFSNPPGERGDATPA